MNILKNNKLKHLVAILFIPFAAVFLPNTLAHAQIDPGGDPTNPLAPACETTPDAVFCNDIDDDNNVFNNVNPFLNIIKIAISIMTVLIAIVSVLVIMYAGIRYIYSGGNAEHIKGAKNTLLYAILGLCLSVLANRIVAIVIS